MKKHIAQFFKFLEDKEGKPAPLRLKLLNPEIFGKPTREDLNVEGNLDLKQTNIKELPRGLKVGESLDLNDCTSLKELPQGLEVGWSLFLIGCTSLKELPQGLKVGWDLWLEDCISLEKIPQGLKVEDGGLHLSSCTSLKELPQGLEVGGTLDLGYCTSLEKLPQGLQVGEDLYLSNTPIAKKYSKEEIRKMIEDGGGFVKKNIYTL